MGSTERLPLGKVFGYWKSRFGFIAAVLGMAVGLGNIWRFPRITAAYGGGSFLIPWAIALLLIAVPLLIAEGIIGIKTGHGTILGLKEWGGLRFTWIGIWICGVCYLIAVYYGVILGWTIRYVVYALQGVFMQYHSGLGQELWGSFISNPVQTLIFTTISWILVYVVMVRGTRGVEVVSKTLMPLLAIILVTLIVRGITLPGAIKGLEYLWSPKIDRLMNAETWLQGFSQTLWSTTAGWGIFLTYSTLFAEKKSEGVTPENNLNAFTTAFGNHSYSLLAGLAVIPAVAALAPLIGAVPEEIYASGNVGFSFIWLAELFSRLPGSTIWVFLFYLALVIAALTSQVGNLLPVVINFQDTLGWGMKKVVTLVTLVGYFASIPSALSVDFLTNQDWAWGLALLLSSVFLSYAVAVKAEEALEYTNTISDVKIGRWWIYLVKYVAPTLVVIVLSWWLISGIMANPEGWWNPLAVDSIGTALVQWMMLFIVSILLGRKIAKK